MQSKYTACTAHPEALNTWPHTGITQRITHPDGYGPLCAVSYEIELFCLGGKLVKTEGVCREVRQEGILRRRETFLLQGSS